MYRKNGGTSKMKFVHCTKKEFLVKARDKNVICFGASKQLTEALKVLQEEIEIVNKVIAVIDNDKEKSGTIIEWNHHSFKVQGIEYFNHNQDKQAIVLITSRYYLEITKQLELIEGWCDTDIFAYACMILDPEEEEESRYQSRMVNQALLEYQEYLDVRNITKTEKNKYYEKMKEYIKDRNKKVIPSIVLMHSNICTLKCEQCCDLIPDTKQKYYIPAKEVLKSAQLLLKGVDKCIRVDLTDGESFLYQELDILLKSLIENDKVETILLVTNATVIPEESILKLLKNEKCFVHISDYGLLEQMSKLIILFEANHINFSVAPNMVWRKFKFNNLEKRKEGKEWLKYEFLRCGNKKCSKPLIGNRFYGCMPAFRFANANIFESEKDYVLLKEEDTPSQIWEKIKQICMIDYIEACQYCNFENTGLPFCRAGEQEGLVQSNYRIVKREESK